MGKRWLINLMLDLFDRGKVLDQQYPKLRRIRH
jgi:hypothetical protein